MRDLGAQPRAWYMSGKGPTTELHPQMVNFDPCLCVFSQGGQVGLKLICSQG